MAVNGIALAGLAAGGLFVYSGVKGISVLKAVQNVIQGTAPASGQQTAQANPVAAGSTGITGAVGTTVSGASETAAKAIGALLATGYGWGPGTRDWPYLESGWQEESGWSVTAANDPSDPYNHAYGIPQANPGTKMASAGADWKTSAATQIRWGLSYIKATYGSPSQVPGWTPSGPASGYEGY